MVTNLQKFGENIKALRLSQEKPQEDVARACGVTKQHLSNIEAGRFAPSTDLAERLAAYFGLTVEELCTQTYVLQAVIVD